MIYKYRIFNNIVELLLIYLGYQVNSIVVIFKCLSFRDTY